MIPLFTPATARKDVNKTQGDGELAKLANLNRLVENVNTIVANGIPASGPTLTYINVGTLTSLAVTFNVGVNPADIPNPTGTKTVQSYYVPQIGMNGNDGNNSTLTSIIFPDVEIGGFIGISGIDTLTTVGFPALTKLLTGSLSIAHSGSSHITLSSSLLNYIAGLLNFNAVAFNLPILTFVGSNFTITNPYSSINFPVLSYIGGGAEIQNASGSINFPLLGAVVGAEGLTISNCSSATSLILSSLTTVVDLNLTDSTFTSINVSSLQTIFSEFTGLNISGLTTLSFPALTSADKINFTNFPNVTSFSAPLLATSGFFFNGLNSITSLSLPSLTTTPNRATEIKNCSSLTSVNLPVFTGGSYLQISDCSNVTSINIPAYTGEVSLSSLPSLTSLTLNADFSENGLGIDDLPAFTSFTTSASTVKITIYSGIGQSGLATINIPNATDFYLLDNREGTPLSTITSLSGPLVETLYVRVTGGSSPTPAALSSVSFPNVTTITRTSIRNTQITTLSYPTVVSYVGDASIYGNDNASLTSVTLGVIGTLKSIVLSSPQIRFENCALSEASVNGILALLVSLDGTNGTTLFGDTYTVNLSGGTSAAPTGQGILDVATLTSRGCTVTTN